MESLADSRGLDVSTPSAEALARTEVALESLLASRGDVHRRVAEALAVDPCCVIAHCIGAYAMLLRGEGHGSWRRRTLRLVERLHGRANERERRHLAALRAWLGGSRRGALDVLGTLLIDHPRDALALCVAHALDFRLGQREMLRDRVAQVLPHWHRALPGFGYVLGMHAFGLEETGDLANAEHSARRALEMNPDHAAAIHVVAHVLEMRGRAREGAAWLESTRAAWAANAGFAVHLAWHLALFRLDEGAIGAALDIYDRALRPSPKSTVAGLVDASALLWRLALRGANVANRFRALTRAWGNKPLQGERAFNLAHAVMAFAAAGQRRRAQRVIDLLRHDEATRAANRAPDLVPGIPVCEALEAFGRGDYALAVERIGAVRAQAERCGGSIAQCDLLHLTFLEAALRDRRLRLARALAAERSMRRPQSLLNRWLQQRAGPELAGAS